jgi:hypothetical protein
VKKATETAHDDRRLTLSPLIEKLSFQSISPLVATMCLGEKVEL